MNTNLLTRDNPELLLLEQEYAALNLFEHSNWSAYSNQIDIQNFRGEYGYLSQMNFGMTPEHYARTYDYVCSLGLRDDLVKLGEDNSFGCITFTSPDGVVYSRDLLDSVLEIDFLNKTLGVDSRSLFPVILDIGSGYGRFAHRYVERFPEGVVYCIDGVPLSTYLCDFYLDFRRVQHRAITVPLSDIEKWIAFWKTRMSFGRINLATNMYSFGEMTLQAINFWLDLCVDLNIQYFFLVPHDYGHTDGAFVSHEIDGRNMDYLPSFEQHGYKIMRRQHKYPREKSPEFVYGTEYVMFERK